jgi:hypothetical protein
MVIGLRVRRRSDDEAIIDSRTLRSGPESEPRAKYDEGEHKRGSNLHMQRLCRKIFIFKHHLKPANINIACSRFDGCGALKV